MSDCPFNLQLQAFHDGELDTQASRTMSEHLANCPSCQSELADLQTVSRLFGSKAAPEMTSLELARLHNSVKGLAKTSARSEANRLAETEFLRTAGMLSALAASVLIISSVWLVEFPSRHAAALSPGVAVVPASDLGVLPTETPDWERTALTLRVEPFPPRLTPGESGEPANSEIGLADSRSFGNNNIVGGQSIDGQVADWMVAGLNPDASGGSHANP
jgi:anti-sigma factor RsiW